MNSPLAGQTSKISIKLFEQLLLYFPELKFGKDEVCISSGNKRYWVDCYNPNNKKVIEFFGDYWHANPNIFKDAALIKCKGQFITASTIRELDKNRLAVLSEVGHPTLVIWESDFRQNPEK